MSTAFPSLDAYLTQIPEFRKRRGRRYDLGPILRLICVAMLCGARSQVAIAEWGQHLNKKWQRRLGFSTQALPSQPTIHRVLQGVGVQQVEQALRGWAEQVMQHVPPPSPTEVEGVAMDGKTLRGSKKRGAVDAHLLSILSHRLTVVLGQVAVPDKTNEITAAEEVLLLVALSGRVVTADALFTQREIAHTILKQGGDYLAVVKLNQKTLYDDIARVFAAADTLADTIQMTQATDQHGNRIAIRTLAASTALQGYTDWPEAQQVLRIQRRIKTKRTGVIRYETGYAITSLSPDRATPAQLLKLWREHWHIENKLHYVRDVTFDEDRSQVHAGHVPQVMAAFRNLVLSFLRALGWENIAAACRYFQSRTRQAVMALGIGLRT